jgi:hypothetical protein
MEGMIVLNAKEALVAVNVAEKKLLFWIVIR